MVTQRTPSHGRVLPNDPVDAGVPPASRALYADRPHHLDWPSWWHAVRNVLNAAIDMEVSMRCAGVAYYSFLSIFPAVASAILVFGLVTDISFIEGRYQVVLDLLPEQAEVMLNDQIVALLTNTNRSLGIGLVVSLTIALWTGSRGTNALVYAISRAHREDGLRSIVGSVAMSIVTTFGVFAVILVSLIGLAVVPAMTSALPFDRFAELLALWLRWPILLTIIFASVCILYRVAPHRRRPRWRWVMPGALFATLAWLGASALFSLYVENFANYNATFGALAAPVIMLLWLYWSTLIFILGATLNAELELQTRKDTTAGPDRPMGERGAYVADNMATR